MKGTFYTWLGAREEEREREGIINENEKYHGKIKEVLITVLRFLQIL